MSWKYLMDVFLGKITSNESKTLTDLSEYKLWFGKYRNTTLEQVWKSDPSYLLWFMTEPTTTCKMTQNRVKEFVTLMGKIDTEHVEQQKALHLKYKTERKELQDYGYLNRSTKSGTKTASRIEKRKAESKSRSDTKPLLKKGSMRSKPINVRQLTLARR